MTDASFHASLRRAFLLALLTPAAACGGAVQGVTSDGSAPESSTPDASTGEDAVAPDASEPRDARVNVDADCTLLGSGPCCAPDIALPVGNACSMYVWAPCDFDGGTVSPEECSALCAPVAPDSGTGYTTCYATAVDGVPAIDCSFCQHTGRRPEGLADAPGKGRSTGAFFAHCAWLEGASVHAFRRLARELSAHGAAPELVAKAERAAEEEVRHARVMSRLAQRYGVKAVRPRASRLGIRGLEAIALENAVEGCVREAYGALVAMWMAEKAQDPAARRALSTIARDEAGHAALAWEVAAWIELRLERGARERVEQAKRGAADGLRAGLAEEPPREVIERAGVPSQREALRLIEAFSQVVLAPVARAA